MEKLTTISQFWVPPFLLFMNIQISFLWRPLWFKVINVTSKKVSVDTFILDTFELQCDFSLGQNNLYVISSDEVFTCDLVLCSFFFFLLFSQGPKRWKTEVFSAKQLNFSIFPLPANYAAESWKKETPCLKESSLQSKDQSYNCPLTWRDGSAQFS